MSLCPFDHEHCEDPDCDCWCHNVPGTNFTQAQIDAARTKDFLNAMATCTATLTCGCRWRRTKEPIRAVEMVRAGHWTECNKHGAVQIQRLTQFLEPRP